MEADLAPVMERTRRAYELGRARTAAARAIVLTLTIAVLGYAVLGSRALTYLPASFLAIWLGEWRGGPFGAGIRRGILAGAATLILPLTILRPCCGAGAPMDGSSCCTMPGACVASGAAVGLALALFLPRASTTQRRIVAAAGMSLGVLSVASLKCSALFLGEAGGLLGGLVAGIAAAGLARAFVDRRRADA